MLHVRRWAIVLLFTVLGFFFCLEGRAQAVTVVATSCSSMLADEDAPASFTLQATAGVAPYTWSVTAGTLPSWIALNPSTGVLSGASAQVGATRFTVTVRDATLATASAACLLAVDPVDETVESYTRAFSVSGRNPEELKAVDLLPNGNFLVGGHAYYRPNSNIFVLAEIDATGTPVWQVLGPTSVDSYAAAVGADAAGNAYIIVTPSIKDHTEVISLRKYAPGGALLWTLPYPSTLKKQADERVVVEDSGYSYALNHIRDNPYTLMMGRVDPAGNLLWMDSLVGDYYSKSLRLDPAGDVYQVGYIGTTAWIRKLSSDQTVLWEKTYTPAMAGTLAVTACDIGFDAAGGAYVFVSIGAGTTSATGGLLKIDAATGDVLWERAAGPVAGALLTTAKGISVDPTGVVKVAGTLFDSATGFNQVAVLSFDQTTGQYIGRRIFGTSGSSELINGVVSDGVNGLFAAGSVTTGTTTRSLVARYATPFATEPPQFSLAGGAYFNGQWVQLTSATPGAQIAYTTDGSTPSFATGTVVDAGTNVLVDRALTLKAIAGVTGSVEYVDSAVTSAIYTFKVGTPTLTPPGGQYGDTQTVTISSATIGATIRYTTDGTLPTRTVGAVLSNGGTVDVDRPMTVKAIAYNDTMTDSAVASGAYTFTLLPVTLSLGTGTYSTVQTVTISSGSVSALIHYTIDGTVPSATAGLELANGGTVTIDRTMTLKAVAYRPGWVPTAVVSATYTLKVNPLTFSPGVGTYNASQTVTISTPTATALIRYTTDGTAPSATAGIELANGGSVTVNQTTTLKAIAYQAGWTSSTVLSAIYTLKVDPLTVSPATGTYSSDQTVTISTPTAGALIRYTTDGTAPSATVGIPLANGGSVPVNRTTTLKAIAYKTGWTATSAVTATYTFKVLPVILSPGTTTAFNPVVVTISTPTADALIRYTTDGTAPTATVGIPLANNSAVVVGRTMTLKAIGYKTGWTATTAATGTYTIKVEPLTFTPAAGSFSATQTVAITTATVGASIRYTTDGTTPTNTVGIALANGGSVVVDRTTTIKAIAYKAGWTSTTAVTAAYTLKVEPLVVSPGLGTYTSDQTVTISTPTAGALVRYTTDGTAPSATVGILLANGGTVLVDRSMTVKAIAFKTGWTATTAASVAFTLKVEPVTLTPGTTTTFNPVTVTISTPTADALIRYTTDGTTPTATTGIVLENGGTVDVDRTTAVKAVGYKTGWTTTTAASATYTLKVEPVSVTPAAGTYTADQTVTISTSTADALIRYTTDGTTPSATAGLEVANGGSVTIDRTTALKVIGYKSGWSSTTVLSAAYTLKVEPVTLTPGTSTSFSPVTVTISTPTTDALIHYTTDGTTPSATAGLEVANGGSVTVDRTAAVKAVGYKAGWTATTAATATYTLKVEPVSLTPAAGTYNAAQTVTISTPTDGALIHYTTDGTTTPSATVGIPLENGGSVAVDGTMTLKVVAYKSGWTATTSLSKAYVVKVDPLTLTPGVGTYTTAQTVTISTPTADALIRYTTDGTTPSATAGIPLANGDAVTVDRTLTLKAIGYKPGWTSTTVISAVYTLKVQPVAFTPGMSISSTPLTVTIATPTEDALIRYTTNGTTPTATSGIELENGGSVLVERTMTLKAVAYKSGWSTTTAASATYTLKVEALTLTPAAGTYTGAQTVTITTATADALINYTTDGTYPSATAGIPLANGGTVAIERTTTLKAIAYKTGWSSTAVTSVLYTLKVEPLTFSPAPGTYTAEQTVTITTPTAGALIRYTTDGTTPTATVGIELANGGSVTVDKKLTLKAVAYKTGWTSTTAATAIYTLNTLPPVFSIPAGAYLDNQVVTITTPTEGALIRYTTDGSTPTTTVGTEIASGGWVLVDRSMTVKAIAYKTGWGATTAVSAIYTMKVAPLVFSPPPGTYSSAQTVTISSPTEGTVIRYTIDGSTPTTTYGTVLGNGGSLFFDSSLTIKAIGYKDGWTSSVVITGAYTF